MGFHGSLTLRSMARLVGSGCSTKRWFLFALVQLCLLCFILSVNRLSFLDLEWNSARQTSDDSNLVVDSLTGENAVLLNIEDIPSQVADEKGTPFKFEDIPFQTDLSKELEERNRLPPKNKGLFPEPAADNVVIVLYVHNRPQYLRIVVNALSKVEGINETLLVVSHDGFYDEMNAIIESIHFCQVKQIFAPFSPHLFPDSFPGVSPGDCQGKDDALAKGCKGNPDQYGNHRSPRIVSLKHHWWWMMNTIWDGLSETRRHDGHIVFIEEDHYLYPNAYRNIQKLIMLKGVKCPECWAVNLAPWDIKSRGEDGEFLVAERIGNMGYSFNRTAWRKIHASANTFCHFDDYNWDITMWASVYPSWGPTVYTLRGPRTSAIHFGKCGLHQGKKDGQPACQDLLGYTPEVNRIDQIMNIKDEWEVIRHPHTGYAKNFKGWGGWGDHRDQHLCLAMSKMYHV